MSDVNQSQLSFRVEISIKCPECENPLPLDGPLETIHCDSCNSAVSFKQDYWVEILSDGCNEMFNVKLGQGMNSMRIGTYMTNLSLARFNPYCDQCKTDFSPNWQQQNKPVYKCTSCGVEYPVSKPQEWLQTKIPKIKYLINALQKEKPLKKHESSVAVIATCPSCSGGLNIDGSTRFVNCNYCNSQIYLPDSIWMKFHTVKQKRRWFVVC